MSRQKAVSVICNVGESPGNYLTNNQDMLHDLLDSCNKRVALSESRWQKLAEYFSGLTEVELKSIYHHSSYLRSVIIENALVGQLYYFFIDICFFILEEVK